jgi:hypothetical protein
MEVRGMKMLRLSVKILILFVGLTLLSTSPGIAESTINWKTYEEGLALGRQESKKLFVHFYADW